MNKKRFVCPVCKKTFYKKIYKKSQAVYCCQKCAYKGRSLGYTKRNIIKPYNCKRRPERQCLICQNSYVYRKKTQKYCSRKCVNISQKERYTGKNNPAYINGNSYLEKSFRGTDWNTIRKEIFERDNYICQKCDIKCYFRNQKNNGYDIIQCHHIEDYAVVKNNHKSNLITVCVRCHFKLHPTKCVRNARIKKNKK